MIRAVRVITAPAFREGQAENDSRDPSASVDQPSAFEELCRRTQGSAVRSTTISSG